MTRLLRWLNLRRNEVPRLGLAGLIFFLVAVDDGIVKSVSSGVFNIRVGPEHLPAMYSWIAVLFSATMVGLSWLTTRVSRQRLVFGLFGVLAALLAANTAALWATRAGDAVPGFYPFLFVSSELIRNVAGFQVWIVAGGICYTSRAKVLFPLLAASTTLGDIGGGFLVRGIGPLLAAWQIYGLAALNTGVVLSLLRPLMRRYFVAPAGDGDTQGAGLAENLRYFAASPYLRLLFLLSLVLFALYTAIHYGFNVVAREHFPEEGDITAFFGLFFGLAGVATLLTTTLLLRHVLRWLGVGNVYLWVCAVHAAAATVLVLVFGRALPLPPVPVILLVNLLNYVLLDAVIAPTYQVLMKLVPERHSDGTRMIMEGGFMLLGGLLGAGVTALHAHGALSLAELFAALLAIAATMVVAGWRLRQRYREVLVQAVRAQNVDVDDEAAMREVLAGSTEVPRGLLLHHSDGVREMGIEILRRNGHVAEEVCLPLLEHENPRIRAAARRALVGAGGEGAALRAALPGLDDGDGEVRLSTARFVARAVESAGGQLADGLRREVVAAVEPRLVPDAGDPGLQAEFLYVLESLHDSGSETGRELLLAGLLDGDTAEEVCAGVDVVRRLGEVAAYPVVFEHLEHPHPAVREAAARAVARLGTREACAALLSALADPDPDVTAAAVSGLEAAAPVHGPQLVAELAAAPTRPWKGLLQALARGGDDTVAEHLLEACRQRLEAADRALVAAAVLRRRDDGAAALLADQLELECRTVRDAAVGLLGELGDVGVVADLLERINDDSPGARDNAVELLENIASGSLLEPLLPLLTDDEEERLERARHVGGWSAAQPDLDTALTLAIADPDPWTRLAGVWAAHCLDRRRLLARLPADGPDFIQEIMTAMEPTELGEAEGQPLTNMEKITFLRESPFFAALPLEELYHIALSVQEESVTAGTRVIEQGSLGDKMYIVVDGQLEVRRFGEGDDAGAQLAQLGDKQVFGDMALLDDEPRSASVIALSDCRLLSLERGDLERILRRYASIAFSMMRILSRRLRRLMAA